MKILKIIAGALIVIAVWALGMLLAVIALAHLLTWVLGL